MRRIRRNPKPRKSHRVTKDPEEWREDFLRPCPYLGHGRDQLALYLMSHEAYAIAESQLRRAIWVNPFEKAFKIHLAECLCRMHRYAEAQELVLKCLEQDPNNVDCRSLLEKIEKRFAAAQPKSI